MRVQAAWQVSYIWAYMHSRGWVLPTVYQGMYNAITRDVERELLPGMIRSPDSIFESFCWALVGVFVFLRL